MPALRTLCHTAALASGVRPDGRWFKTSASSRQEEAIMSTQAGPRNLWEIGGEKSTVGGFSGS